VKEEKEEAQRKRLLEPSRVVLAYTDYGNVGRDDSKHKWAIANAVLHSPLESAFCGAFAADGGEFGPNVRVVGVTRKVDFVEPSGTANQLDMDGDTLVWSYQEKGMKGMKIASKGPIRFDSSNCHVHAYIDAQGQNPMVPAGYHGAGSLLSGVSAQMLPADRKTLAEFAVVPDFAKAGEILRIKRIIRSDDHLAIISNTYNEEMCSRLWTPVGIWLNSMVSTDLEIKEENGFWEIKLGGASIYHSFENFGAAFSFLVSRGYKEESRYTAGATTTVTLTKEHK